MIFMIYKLKLIVYVLYFLLGFFTLIVAFPPAG